MAMTNMVITALLPMKGHSERIQNKNLRTFCGVPLYHHIVHTLIRSEHISNIIIDTDSENIKADVKKYFPEIILIDRPEKNIGDDIAMNQIIAYDISLCESDIYIQTHSTNPLLQSKSIDDVIHFFINNNYDSVFSVSRIQSRLYDSKGMAMNHDPGILLRTQDIKPVYEENSCFYIFTKRSFQEAGNRRIGNKPYLFELSRSESIDIDETEDFEIAEAIFKNKNS